MSYVWSDGEKITAEKLNALEATASTASEQAEKAVDTVTSYKKENDAAVEEIEASLAAINTALGDMWLVARVDEDNWECENTYYSSTIDASKSGYTPIGVVGFRLSNGSDSGKNISYCALYNCYLSGSTVYYSVRSYATTYTKGRTYVYVLYKKND